MTHRLRLYTILALFVGLFTLLTVRVYAQNDPLPVTRTAEYDIGFKCPVSATLDPAQTVLWVLMNSCGTTHFELHGFNIADGTPVTADANNFADALTPLDNQVVYASVVPLAFTPDAAVDVIYYDLNSYEALNVRLSITSDTAGASPAILLTRDRVEKLIPGYAGYLETTVYNIDHTVAIVADTTIFHIIDLQSGSELFQLEAKPDTYSSYSSFSADSKTLYITTLKNPDDVKDYRSVLNVYSLPDGALKATYDVPSFILWVSPDGRYGAAQLSDTELVVVELATGRISETLPINEAPHHATKCLNDGRSIADVDFRTSGALSLIDLSWLPDSSGFLTVNSSTGEAVGGGRLCYLEYSRLRHYTVGTGG